MTERSPLDPMLPELLPVTGVIRETSDTFTLTLDAAPRGGFTFEPGQFNMLFSPGAGESAISIAGAPHRPERLVHTVRAVGGVTQLLKRLRRGDHLGVRGPFGRGWPLLEARGADLVVVAGGIGLAPLRPVMLHALHHARDFSSIALVYGARTPGDLLYRRELERWAKSARVEVTVDRGDPGWSGHTGVVTKLLARAVRSPATTLAMVCGPEVMMRFAARELAALGVPPERTFVSIERNMKCGVGLCGHCQLGPLLLCRDGPALPYERVRPLLAVREL